MTRILSLLVVIAAWSNVVHGFKPSEPAVQAVVRNMVHSLPQARRRALLQSSEESGCAWDKENKQCSVKPLTALGFLEKAPETALKDLIVSTLECYFQSGEDSCTKNDQCTWDKTYQVCEYIGDVTKADSFKRCVGDAAVFLESAERSQVCSQEYTTKDSCNISKYCGWDPESEICTFDTLKSLTGIPAIDSLPKGLAEIIQVRGAQMGEVLVDMDLQEPEDILTWDPPPFVCPDGVDQVICNIAQQGDEYIKIEVFCASQNVEKGICNEDKRCFFDDAIDDDTLKCRISPELEIEARNKQREIFLDTISNPTAVSILRKEFKCMDSPKDSCKGDCLWSKEGKSCNIDAQVVIQEMAKHPLEVGYGADCELVKEIFSSGCLAFNTELCGGEKRCMWDSVDGFCVPGPLALTDILFKDDVELKSQATSIFKKCHDTETESECL